MEKVYVPLEVVQAFVKLGFDSEDIAVKNIDSGFYTIDGISGKQYVHYGVFSDVEQPNETISFQVGADDFVIRLNDEEIARDVCTYDLNYKNDTPLGEVHTVENA